MSATGNSRQDAQRGIAPRRAKARSIAVSPLLVLTVDELAARWNVNAKTIYVAIQARKLAVLRLGRVIRISLRVIESMETQGCVVLPGGHHGSST